MLLAKSSVPWSGKCVFHVVGQSHPHLHLPEPLLEDALAFHLQDRQQRRLLDIEIGVHRIDRHDRRQQRAVGVDEVAGRQQRAADLAGQGAVIRVKSRFNWACSTCARADFNAPMFSACWAKY